MNLFLDKYILKKDNKYFFKEEYTNFNNTKVLVSKKTKINQKYYVYDRESQKPVKIEPDTFPKLKKIETVELANNKVIFYTDIKGNLSFTRTSKNVESEQFFIEQLENSPTFRFKIISFWKKIYLFGVVRLKQYEYDSIDASFGYDKKLKSPFKFLFSKKIRDRFKNRENKLSLITHICMVKIPLKELVLYYEQTSNINVPFFISIKEKKETYSYSLKEQSKDKYDKEHYLYNTRSFNQQKNLSLFIRKSVTGQYVMVFTDVLSKNIVLKEVMANIWSKFYKKNKYLLFFEKFGDGASESGFEMFKYYLERDPNCRYLLNKSNNEFSTLKKKYGNKLVAKNSIRAFFVIFNAKTFISSDLVSHVQRRLYDNDRLIKKKILSCNKKIFLQHGVSLATDLFERGYYNQKVPIAPDYVLTNSNYETKLFMEKARYKKFQIIETGLPNLDMYALSKSIIKTEITFLLTWRPWDLTGDDTSSTSYISRYGEFLEIVEADGFFKNKKINLVLHPKSKKILQTQFPELYDQFSRYFFEGDIKEVLLKTKVLITDYSSVCYYAFCGGSNVIFYWEDKEKAEFEYGAPNIIQKNNVFGDVVFKMNNLKQVVKDNYGRTQSNYYKKKYNILCSYTDGHNTEQTYLKLSRLLNETKK